MPGKRRLDGTFEPSTIPNAKLVELDSADHLIWLTDAIDTMINEIQDFVTNAVPVHDVARQLAFSLDSG